MLRKYGQWDWWVLIASGCLSTLLIIRARLAVPIIGSVPLFMIGAFIASYLPTTSIWHIFSTIKPAISQLGILMILVHFKTLNKSFKRHTPREYA